MTLVITFKLSAMNEPRKRTLAERMTDFIFMREHKEAMEFCARINELDLTTYEGFNTARQILLDDANFKEEYDFYLDIIAKQQKLDLDIYRHFWIAKSVFINSIVSN